MDKYLKSTEIIDFENPMVLSKAKELAHGIVSHTEIAKSIFEWVRDQIKHIGDYNIQTVSCSASEVLESGSGSCYAKSHLLAALLRANSIPTGLCYQRISIGDYGEPPYCLHGLNAVYLPEFGWYKIDSRGNKEGVSAQFIPPVEQLAFPIQSAEEIDFPEILSDPLPVIIQSLKKYTVKDELWDNLPDLKTI